ncbi:MAG: hypothetical protein Q8Q09_05005 [Deltaproteobacteria bacterium]|nr:hypothetical protein [Deltaproteobacteria bacterium]
MLVVVSDLHFQHVSMDSLRYVEKGVVREAGVRRNVSPGALQLLLADVMRHAERTQAKHIELIFNGDIFELLRTPLWFDSGSSLRPYTAALGPDRADNPLRNRVHHILEAIARDNAGCWPILQRFVRDRVLERKGQERSLSPDTVITVRYLPGNHDRLANAWPSVRARVRELLAMSPSDAPFDHVVDRPFSDGYGVRVRHGHEYDPANVGVEVPFGSPITLSDVDYMQPCLGDYVTLDVIARISTAFRTYYAAALREESLEGQRLRAFYSALIEFDDVRPPTLLVRYLIKRLGGTSQETFELLRPVLIDAYRHAIEDPFVRDMAGRLALLRFVTDPIATLVREALQALSPASLELLVLKAQSLDSSNSTSRGALMASHEEGLAEGHFDVLIAGHTHQPEQIPLPSPGDNDAFFVDVGTWRSTIKHGVSGVFGRLRSYTAAFVYSDEEQRWAGDGRRFETWTGHLAAGEFGPFDKALGASGAATHTLTLSHIDVLQIDEGDTSDGAELLLEWGVDGTSMIVRRDGVQNASRIMLSPEQSRVALTPSHNGELWVFGREIDRGETATFDPDDTLPWALGFLRRNVDGSFVEGEGELLLTSRSGADLRVRYRVSPIA